MLKYTMRFIIITLLLLTSIFATAQSDYAPVFEEVACFFPDLKVEMTCGYLYTVEDRSNPQAGEVELAVIILHARTANPAPDPVIYLEGGPGGAALLVTEDLARHPVLDTRDIILFDQRGTGFSYPSLNCPEIEAGESEDAIAECRDRLLNDGVNLNMYNTAASAADVNDLRIALEYEQVNLWGISYGTKLALITMRDHPQGIRSVVIDSVYPPEIDDLALTPVSFIEAYEALFDRCAADAACANAFPDLEAAFYDLVDRLNQTPENIETEEDTIELTGDELLGQLFLALYDTTRIPYLPFALMLMADAEDQEDLLSGYLLLTGLESPDAEDAPPSIIADSTFLAEYTDQFGDINDSEGMNYSFDCSEEYQLNDVDAAYAAAEAAPEALREYFISGIQSSIESCQIWGVDTASPREAERVQSSIPTLIYSGVFDPVTPVSSGDSAAAGLSNSVHVVFPTAGHGISLTDNAAGTCAKQIMMAFLNNPSAAVDTSCVDRTNVITFYVGD